MVRDYEKKIGEEYAKDLAKQNKILTKKQLLQLKSKIAELDDLETMMIATSAINTALSLYAEKEVMKKREEKRIEEWIKRRTD